MRESLQRRADLLLANEAATRKAVKLDFEETTKLAALIVASQGKHTDSSKLKECAQILKKRTGVLSNWRGIMRTAVLARMSLADDPAAYLEGVIAVYEKLTAGKVFRSEYQAICAMCLYEQCPPERIDDMVERTLAQFEFAREAHPILTDSADLPIIALMVLTGNDVAEMGRRAEECYGLLKLLFKLYPETKQMVSHVLALSDKPAAEKVDAFWSLRLALRDAKHEIALGPAVSILAAFVDTGVPQEQLVAEIGELDVYLKGNKGYGALGVGASFRRLMAATLVLQDHEDEHGASSANVMGSTIAQIIAEQIIDTIIMIIIVSSVHAPTSSSS